MIPLGCCCYAATTVNNATDTLLPSNHLKTDASAGKARDYLPAQSSAISNRHDPSIGERLGDRGYAPLPDRVRAAIGFTSADRKGEAIGSAGIIG